MPAAIFSASRRASPRAGNALTRNSRLATGVPTSIEACQAASVERSCSSRSISALAEWEAGSPSGSSSTHARTSSSSSWRRPSRPTDSTITRIASCGSMKHRGMVIVALFASEGDGTKGTVGSGSDGIGGTPRSELFRTLEQCLEMPGALPRTSLPDQAFHRLVSDVLAGRYAPGERLPTQRALAAELGVNMASVREGVKRLEQLGLVEVRHGDAMRVL